MRLPYYLLVKILLIISIVIATFSGCSAPPTKSFFIINYEPAPLSSKKLSAPYPYTIRIKNFDVENAYAKPNIVYRKSPYQLSYYFYRVWAVKPQKMLTDVLFKHISAVNLVSHVVRRLDEGFKPDYEISGIIEAIEEYDSDDIWFAHLAIRIKLVRLSDGKTLYNRRFDKRKKIDIHTPDYVVRGLSEIADYIFTQALIDIDNILASEYGIQSSPKQQENITGEN